MTCLFHIDPQSAEEALLDTWDDYGIDEEAPYPDVETDNDVVIPESLIHLNENQQSHLEQTIDPLFDDNNEGIDLYQQTVNALTNLL